MTTNTEASAGNHHTKFKDIQHPPSLLESFCVSRPLLRKDLHIPHQQPRQDCFAAPEAFILEGLLSKEEAEWYILEAEKAGTESLEGIFPKEYRSNHRLLTLSTPAARALFHRILPSLSPIGTPLSSPPPPQFNLKYF